MTAGHTATSESRGLSSGLSAGGERTFFYSAGASYEYLVGAAGWESGVGSRQRAQRGGARTFLLTSTVHGLFHASGIRKVGLVGVSAMFLKFPVACCRRT